MKLRLPENNQVIAIPDDLADVLRILADTLDPDSKLSATFHKYFREDFVPVTIHVSTEKEALDLFAALVAGEYHKSPAMINLEDEIPVALTRQSSSADIDAAIAAHRARLS